MSIAAGIWLTSLAFHITFPYPASFLVMTILVVGVAAPTPGAIGGFHFAYKFAVTAFFAVPPDRALGAATVLHAISFVPVTLLGIGFMMREGLTLAGARQMAHSAAADEEVARPTSGVRARPDPEAASGSAAIAPLKRGAR
jgi:hypothetical protein